jgi:hypothetical protein
MINDQNVEQSKENYDKRSPMKDVSKKQTITFLI